MDYPMVLICSKPLPEVTSTEFTMSLQGVFCLTRLGNYSFFLGGGGTSALVAILCFCIGFNNFVIFHKPLEKLKLFLKCLTADKVMPIRNF